MWKLSHHNQENPVETLKKILGLRSSPPANIILGEAKIPPVEIRFRYLARSFGTRMLMYEANSLRTTLEEIIDWKETQ
jgi:hypothetical protein